MDATSPETTAPTEVRPWVISLRHLAGVAAVSAAAHFLLYGTISTSGSSLLDWLAKLAVVIAAAVIICSLWALFATSRSRGRFKGNLIRLTWALTLLVAVGEWTTINRDSRVDTVPKAARVQAPIHAVNAPPAKERKVDELRRLYPRFAGKSDADVLTEIAADYPEVPVGKIATDLGLIPPAGR